jgi:hypothetical protein
LTQRGGKNRHKGEILEKEWLYVGHYTDTDGLYVLKIGTTNDLCRRQSEHTRNYRRATKHTMPSNSQFCMDWYIPLSKYNTLRYEDSNRSLWQQLGLGQFVRNDRFVFEQKPASVKIKIRKEYEVLL